MGMDQQSIGFLQEGINLAGDVMGMVNATSGRSSDDGSAMVEERARMMELDARSGAHSAQQRARLRSEDLRDQREAERGRQQTRWGQSNLAMSGSKALVREGRQVEDRQDEDDERFQGDMEAEEALRQGRRQANLFRIGNGVSPSRSTLSLGSTIYKYGR